MTKLCRGCDKVLPLGAFGKTTSKRSTIKSMCKPCRNAAYRRWREAKKAKDPEGYAEAHRARQHRYLERMGKPLPTPRPQLSAEELALRRQLEAERSERKAQRARIKEAIRIGYEGGVPIPRIAEMCGMTAPSVRDVARKMGVTHPLSPRSSTEWRDEAIEMRRAGLSYTEIAKRVRASEGTVQNVCLTAGMTGIRAHTPPDYSHIKVVPLPVLENRIIKPGFEKHLTPLVKFKGGDMSLGRVHRMWNFLGEMLESDCRSINEAASQMGHNPAYSHLCGPARAPKHIGLYGFTSRILLSPEVKDLDPELFDYVRYLNPTPFDLQRVADISHDRRHAWWRTYQAPDGSLRRAKAKAEPRAPIDYPFLIHDGGKPEHDLVRAVNNAVPRYLPPDLRADICQDIIVGILCGDFDKDNLTLPAKEMTKRVMKMFPTKYGPISLDAPIPGTDGLRLIDTI